MQLTTGTERTGLMVPCPGAISFCRGIANKNHSGSNRHQSRTLKGRKLQQDKGGRRDGEYTYHDETEGRAQHEVGRAPPAASPPPQPRLLVLEMKAPATQTRTETAPPTRTRTYQTFQSKNRLYIRRKPIQETESTPVSGHHKCRPPSTSLLILKPLDPSIPPWRKEETTAVATALDLGPLPCLGRGRQCQTQRSFQGAVGCNFGRRGSSRAGGAHHD
jgi:hypothetical protein